MLMSSKRPALLLVNMFGLFLEAAAHDCCFRLYETAEVIGPVLGHCLGIWGGFTLQRSCYDLTAWHGADLDTRLAQALAAVPKLADEPELSHALVGLTHKLLGAGQYGQTMLVSFRGFPLLYGCLYTCCMATNIILGKKRVHTLLGSCQQLVAELKHQALLWYGRAVSCANPAYQQA